MRVLFLLSGGYGSGKTYFARNLCGAGNVVSLAAPIRSDLFRLFLDDRFHSTEQAVKNELIGLTEIKRALGKDKVSKLSRPVLDRFHEVIDGKDLTTLTVRDMLIAWGDAGRAYRKSYWIQRTIKILEGITGNLLAVDDVRFINELESLKKWADKKGMLVQHYYIGSDCSGYDNSELSELADYRMHWGS